ncbi:hypothetical protein E4U54_003956 [Claviceps lovelessii]|nr:hypothetical protein E4U54_003956 [Claviceps lovelessii]
MASTKFYQSQIGSGSVINYSYTDFPAKLLLKDLWYFFVYAWAVPLVLLPFRPCGSDDLDELYMSFKNVFALAVQALLTVLQLLFIFSLPLAFFFPLWMSGIGVIGFFVLNFGLCMLLNSRNLEYVSDEKYAQDLPEHAHEHWVYLNGVATGTHWHKNNLNRLALTFGRRVHGIHNRTSGILFDLVECIIQRNFCYATRDVRICYSILRGLLYNPNKTKIIFILHSQGGIEGGLVLDWLLQEMPQDLLSKLEVYTFGNAANHFNNPHRHVVSQALEMLNPVAAIKTFFSEPSLSAPVVDRVDEKHGDDVARFTLAAASKDTFASVTSSRTLIAAKDRAIGHIEHYAHTTDFVALWGVLHFATNKRMSEQLPRFMGRLFSRSTGRGGHLLNHHYLDGMFPLKRDPKTGHLTGADEENPFMEETIGVDQDGDRMTHTREDFEIAYLNTEGLGNGDIATPPLKEAMRRRRSRGDVKVKEVSRLWSYRNGQSPSGYARNGTAVF